MDPLQWLQTGGLVVDSDAGLTGLTDQGGQPVDPSIFGGGGTTLGATTGGSTGGSYGGSSGGYSAPAPPQPTAEQRAASAAEQAEAQRRAGEVGTLKSDIVARRQRANSIFDALTQAVGTLAREKRAGLETQFQEEQGRATEGFTREGDTLRRSYAGRGLGDSSYRINAEDQAGTQYQRALTDLGRGRESGLAKVGGEAATNLAGIDADRGSVNSVNLDEIRGQVRETGADQFGLKSYNLSELGDDVSSLRSLRDQVDERIRKAEVQNATLGTAEGFKGKLDQIAPYKGVNNALEGALRSLVDSAAPKVVKDRIASAIIGNYAPGDSQLYQNFYDTESKKTESPTSVA